MIDNIKVSNRKNKKYMVKSPKGRIIHFGDKRYEHYEDKTNIKAYSYLNHYSKKRRDNYLKRAKGIKNKNGELTYKDKETPNYYSIKYLW